ALRPEDSALLEYHGRADVADSHPRLPPGDGTRSPSRRRMSPGLPPVSRPHTTLDSISDLFRLDAWADRPIPLTVCEKSSCFLLVLSGLVATATSTYFSVLGTLEYANFAPPCFQKSLLFSYTHRWLFWLPTEQAANPSGSSGSFADDFLMMTSSTTVARTADITSQYVKILTSVCPFLGIASRTPAGPIREVGRPVEGWWREGWAAGSGTSPSARQTKFRGRQCEDGIYSGAQARSILKISVAGIRRWCDPSVGPGHAFASKAVLPASVL
ncbi:unnamed protein product, partial [Nesidiocoris tenuis]